MKKIINPWTGKEHYFCFGCCPDNPEGVKMEFYAEGDEAISIWKPSRPYQGWVDTLHGGIQSVLLDEICAWAVMLKMNTTGMTIRMETQFKHHISTEGGCLVLRAKVNSVQHHIAEITGTISNAEGEVCAIAKCTYFTFPPEKALEMGFHGLRLEGKETTVEQVMEEKR